MKQPIGRFTSRYVALRADDVDTDQIIPARFLTTTERTGLGAHLFHDWRHLADGSANPAFVLNRPESHGARILVAGRNFGCGSSREHAVWALAGAGFQAVVSESFADIFRSNALGNGLLPIQVAPKVAGALLDAGGGELTVDLENETLARGGVVVARFPIAPFAKHCLMRGIDELEFLLAARDEISSYELRAGVAE
jgi:3-isopropylmalate/(R)-2-methylmalate dehydratase small subunit